MEKKIKELVEELRNYSVPELCDGMEGGLYHTMDYQIKPHVTQQKIVGPAFTVKVPVGEGAIVTNALDPVYFFFLPCKIEFEWLDVHTGCRISCVVHQLHQLFLSKTVRFIISSVASACF